MNVIFTCGGTGGHINPAIAVANMWKARYPDSKILFIGAVGGMEEKLVPKAGYELKTLPGGGLSRSLSFAGIKKNVKVMYNLMSSVSRCKKIIRDFKADIVVGTGGYASFPALMAAGMLKIPSCVHESNAVPGLTTRMAERWASKILICFPQSARYYKDQSKVQIVGMPVHSQFLHGSKQASREELGLENNRPVILSAFGSLGAKAMNEMTAELLRLEKEAGYPFQHIHAVGKFGWEWLPALVKEKGVDTENGSVFLKEYIYNMPTVMTAADIVIGRAGSSSLNEIAAAGIPCILIPSPNVTANHQEKNARALEEQGAAVVMLESECTAQGVMDQINRLLNDSDAYSRMRSALLGMAVPDSAERMCTIMEELISGNTKK